MDRNREIESAAESRLVRLGDLKNFQVVDGDHDIRGWEVRAPEGPKVGKVEELLVDEAERRVRYVHVKVDKSALNIDNDRHVLVPIGAIGLDPNRKDVLLERLPIQGLAGVPAYKGGPITREYETSLRSYYGATAATAAAAAADAKDYYRDDLYSDARLRRGSSAEYDAGQVTGLPKVGDNEVTVPLTEGQEVIIKRPESGDEIVIKRNVTGAAEKRD
ncbi:MAG TPA: PRC-barrel domain-containing protein [Gemmatimonadaceae bacterium]|nr:PRC-barrel domain-containing protein [Gemmatimonadaceae bacterium]